MNYPPFTAAGDFGKYPGKIRRKSFCPRATVSLSPRLPPEAAREGGNRVSGLRSFMGIERFSELAWFLGGQVRVEH